mmetsp:Transcript_20333/g.50274  ORF Transcript_20333/g.50274 Transcript_20333/m.50274 type:complete len:213 (+) Transcript_20333:945-1583(+)
MTDAPPRSKTDANGRLSAVLDKSNQINSRSPSLGNIPICKRSNVNGVASCVFSERDDFVGECVNHQSFLVFAFRVGLPVFESHLRDFHLFQQASKPVGQKIELELLKLPIPFLEDLLTRSILDDSAHSFRRRTKMWKARRRHRRLQVHHRHLFPRLLRHRPSHRPRQCRAHHDIRLPHRLQYLLPARQHQLPDHLRDDAHEAHPRVVVRGGV